MTSKATDGGMVLPAMRGKQGSRTMYFCLPRNAVLARRFSRELEVEEEQETQRPFDERRAKEIGAYMVDNPQTYVLGTVTYSMDCEGVFDPAVPGADYGTLTIPLDASIKCVDGQHRIGAIHGVAVEIADLAKEHTAVLIYVESDLTSRRQMFRDMNYHQIRVNTSINIDFDSRNLFSRVTQQLADNHPLLKDRVERKKASVAKTSHSLFTLGAVYDAMGRLCTGAGGRLRDKQKYGSEQDLLKLGNEFFDWLSTREELRQARKDPETTIKLREKSILLSSTTLKMLASAVHVVREQNEGIKFRDLIAPLTAIDFGPRAKLWRKTGFVSPGKRTPNARLQEIKAAADEVAKALSPIPVAV